MADWAEQYLAALRARDEVEKANVELYDYCARLADQKAELQKQVRSQPQEAPASPPPTLAGLRRVASPPARPESPSVQIRQDLAKAQQERVDLQTRLDATKRDLEALKSKSKTDTRKFNQLTANVSRLEVKLRDRDEELKEKAKLVESVQDENVTLNLQLNMADEQAKTLKKENQDYINRLMARKGKEADRMNDESKFG